MAMLPTIADVTILSEEVKSGQVYGVVQLYKVLEDKPALEKSPADVFARTYLTDALRTALNQVRYKLSGQDQRGGLVFTGGYGSGKSHQLLALYHTLTHPDLAAQWLGRHGYDEPLPTPNNLIVIVLHTARVDYDNLWEPIFQQLGAEDTLRQVKRYPTIPQIRQALGNRPVVIIVDEIENWYETILPQRVGTAQTVRLSPLASLRTGAHGEACWSTWPSARPQSAATSGPKPSSTATRISWAASRARPWRASNCWWTNIASGPLKRSPTPRSSACGL
jgi:hypothetical protein